MPGISENLSTFNRKERFFLVGMALGNPEFKLCEQFRNKVGEALHISIPEDAFAAMDYHLDWIYASLFLASDKTKAQVFLNTEGLVTATQEDIDFLIAYQDGNAYHMVFLEAKGVMGFTNRQLQSKVERLRDIFGGNKYPDVIPHFAIVSPKRPIRIRTNGWPTWIKPNSEIPWIKMSIPAGLRRITRCDETGKASAKGKWWRTITPSAAASSAPVIINGQTYYRSSEICQMAGISRTTLLRWFKTGIIEEVAYRDRRGWRLFTEDDRNKIKTEASEILGNGRDLK